MLGRAQARPGRGGRSGGGWSRVKGAAAVLAGRLRQGGGVVGVEAAGEDEKEHTFMNEL